MLKCEPERPKAHFENPNQDWFFGKEESYLFTYILSPDYVEDTEKKHGS